MNSLGARAVSGDLSPLCFTLATEMATNVANMTQNGPQGWLSLSSNTVHLCGPKTAAGKNAEQVYWLSENEAAVVIHVRQSLTASEKFPGRSLIGSWTAPRTQLPCVNGCRDCEWL